jgi:hypothetical protein
MQELIAAIVLEAAYQMCKARGFRQSRREFYAAGSRILKAMAARGEL